MTRPRVLLATESVRAGNGGIARVARLMAKVLGERTDPVTGIAFSDPQPSSDLGVSFRTARGSRTRYVLEVNRAIPTHTHFVYDCLGMSRAHQWLPIPHRPSLAYVHGIEVWTGTAHSKQVAAAPRMTHLLSNSLHTRDRAAELDPRFARAEVCWLATESDDPPASTPRTGGPPRVTIVGRVVPNRYKGHDELFRAWPAVLAAVPDAVLTVAGTGPALPQVRKLAAELGLPENQVEFRGFVPEAVMPQLWAETTVFAMPSRGEGFGLVYIEAMRHSVPVIGSVHDAAPEVNLDGVTGYNVDLTRPSQLADRLIHLLRNRDEASRLGANGFRRWQTAFRYSAFRSRFEPILNRFLSR